MSEVVDIVVKESGSVQAAANIQKVSASSAEGQARLDAYAATLAGTSSKAQGLVQASSGVESQIRNTGNSATAATAAHKAHHAEMEHGVEVANHLKETMVALGLALGVKEWVELTDAYQVNVNGLKQVSTSQENLIATQVALKEISQETFSSLDANTNLYVRLSKAGKDLNVTQTEMLGVIQTLNNGLRLAGNSVSDAGRAITQLSVAMMTGEGSSRALLAIMRQMPDLTTALAAKFFTGRDAVLQFKNAATDGSLSIERIIKGIASLNPIQEELREKMEASTGAVRSHGEALQTDAEKAMIASGRMFDFSKVAGETNRNVIDLSKSSVAASHEVEAVGVSAGHAAHSIEGIKTSAEAMSASATSSFGTVGRAIMSVDGAQTKFEQNVKKLEPTIAQAWQTMKNAMFSYVGESDQASASSEKIAQVIEFVAHNFGSFFGVLTVVTAFLGTYITVAGVARAATMLLSASFSPFYLVIAILAAATTAIFAFGQGIKLTADGSISVLGAFLGVLNVVYQGIQEVWHYVQQSPSYWGPAILAVTGLMVAMRLLLGINVFTWVIQATAAMINFAVATLAAAGPWGILAAAIIAAALAFAYYNGYLDAAIDKLQNKLTPLVLTLVQKMKDLTTETNKSGSAAKDFGNVFTDQIQRVTDGFQSGLLPAISNTTSAVTALKNVAVTDMGQAAASVNNVTSALAAMTSQASSAGGAMSTIKGPSGGASGQGGAGATGSFTSWQLVSKSDLNGAIMDASRISVSEGGKGAGGDIVGQLYGVETNPFDSNNMANALQSLSGLSANAKAYLKDRITPYALPIGFASGGSFQVGGAGGTDSQLVQFMASPDETVSVSTPRQQAAGQNGKQITVQMIVQTPDAASFSRTGRQIITQLESQLNRIASRS